MKASAVLFTGVNCVQMGEVEIPEPMEGEVLVRAAYTCISPGSELRCLAGQQPGADAFPFIPGYALAGHIVAGGASTKLAPGDAVLCAGTARASLNRVWGGHVAFATVPESRVYRLPAGVDPLDASVAPLAAIACHGLRVCRPFGGERIAVVGLGPVGQFAARLHSAAGARVVAADLRAERVAVARDAGVQAFVPRGRLGEAFREFWPEGADTVIDSTGSARALAEVVDVARETPWGDDHPFGPRLVIQGSYTDAFAVPYQAAFMRELTILVPRSYQRRDLTAVLDMIAAELLSVRDVISDVRPVSRAAPTYRDLRLNRRPLLTVAFRW